MQLGDVRVLEALGRLVEERLDVVGVEELHEFAQRAAQRAIALGERRDARAVGVVDRLRGRQYGERLVRLRERRARVADDVFGLRPAAHHPRAGTRQVDARVEQLLGRPAGRVDLRDRDIRQIVDAAARRRERPEAERFDREQEETEHGQHAEQTRRELDFSEHGGFLESGR